MDTPSAWQNLDSKELAGKIFRNKDLDRMCWRPSFCKLFIALDLADWDIFSGWQNLDSKDVAGKIFRNKDLEETC